MLLHATSPRLRYADAMRLMLLARYGDSPMFDDAITPLILR